MIPAEYVSAIVYPAALAMLPPRMSSREAKAMVLGFGFQESGFTHRRQVRGPAHGFWQFEEAGGVNGVLAHDATKPIIDPILAAMSVRPWECYDAITDNDILACIFARLLLWTHPRALPGRNDPEGAWAQYLDTWRPGKPHHETWAGNLDRAWSLVERSSQ